MFSGVIATFNSWHGNSEIVCSQYTDPRELFDERGACKECKIQCIPRRVSELLCYTDDRKLNAGASLAKYINLTK